MSSAASWRQHRGEGSFPGHVVKSPAIPAGTGIRAGARCYGAGGRDARMPAFTGLTGDLCYAVPPLAKAECAWRRALMRRRALFHEAVTGHQGGSRRAGTARRQGAAGGRLGVGMLSLEVGSFPVGGRLMVDKWQFAN